MSSHSNTRVLKWSENRGAPACARRSGYLTFCLCFFCIVFLINIILYHLFVYTIPYPVLAILTLPSTSLIYTLLPPHSHLLLLFETGCIYVPMKITIG